jgi:hypothetical protein
MCRGAGTSTDMATLQKANVPQLGLVMSGMTSDF